MQSKSILLTTFGSFGDIHPYMALALELKTRGHTAVIGTSELYRNKIESAGIEFTAIRPDLPNPNTKDANAMFAKIMDQKLGTETVIKDFILSGLPNTYADILAAATSFKCDLIISHALSYASVLVAEKLSILWVFTALQPIIMFSADDASVPPEMPWAVHFRIFGARFYRTLMDKGSKRFADWAAPIYDLRGKLGLPTDIPNPVLGGHFSPHLNLALFSKHFAPAANDWPAKTVQTGFPFYDTQDSSQQPLPANVEKFLHDGEPPIVFTLGTAAVRDAGSFYQTSLDAARSLGKRSLLLTGVESGNDSDLKLGSDTLAVDYAPYSAVFSRANLIVHQGGIGTTSQALRSGRPMLIMPYGHDQPDNAARCERLGVAKSISRRNYSSSRVATLINHLLSDKQALARSKEIGEAVAAESGVKDACDAVEKLL